MIDLSKLEPSEAERLAYAEGFTGVAALYARIADLEAERDALAQEVEDLKDEWNDNSLQSWENENGDANDYKNFFFDCFTRLAGHYLVPDVSSDYDKSVIFAAIEKGEEADANETAK